MFCAAVMCGHSAYDWNIIAVPRFSGGRARDVAAVDADRARARRHEPAIERSSVVLPQPELPSSATISPRATSRGSRSSTRVEP